MTQEPVPVRRTVEDPLALRALAHPVRLKLVQLVGRVGRITGTEAARQLGISQALASHHLRQLAKYGFIERAPGEDGRGRPWRVTSTSMDTKSGHPEGRAATDLLQQHLLQEAALQLQEWQRRRDQYDARWAAPTELASGLIYLTVDEMEELRAGLDALIEPLVQRRRIGDHAGRPDDAVPVAFTVLATPVPATENGG